MTRKRNPANHWPIWMPRILWLRRECPLCTSIEFRAGEAGPFDSVLRILALRRVRCVNCWRKYYWFVRMGPGRERLAHADVAK